MMIARATRRALLSVGLAGALAVSAAVGSAGAAPVGPGSWSGLIDWNNFVAVHLAVTPAGDVLIWDREEGLTSARRWDPATGAFSPTPGLPTALFCAFQTRLPGGQLIVVGGTALKKGAGGNELAGTGLDQTRIFDFATSTWSIGGAMKTPRWYPTVVALADGRQVALGGQVKKGVLANLSELYDPATNTWTELTGLAEPKALDLYPRAMLAPNGKVFVVKNGAGKSAYMDVDTQTWTTVGKPPPVPGGGGMAMYESGKLLLFATGKSATDSWTIDLNAATPIWRKVGSLTYPRKKFSTVLLPDGRVMAIGGSSDGTSDPARAVLTPEIWDPATGTWTTLPDLAVPRMYHSNALLLPDGRVLSAGGGRTPGAQDYPNAQLYSPEYLSLPSRPSITSLSSTVWTAGGTASLGVSSTAGLGSVVLMGLPAVTHGIDTSARRIVLPIASAYDPGTGTVKVGIPSVANVPAGHYYAIALDGRGVPSQARIVQVVAGGGAAAAAAAAPAPLATPQRGVPRVVVVPEATEKD